LRENAGEIGGNRSCGGFGLYSGIRPNTVAAAGGHGASVGRATYVCGEHPAGQIPTLGNDLGADCSVTGRVEIAGGRFSRAYRTDGRSNEDYFGWRAPVLAPFDGVVEAVRASDTDNAPGIMGAGVPGLIVFRRDDGVLVVFAHIDDPRVAVGDRVRAGQEIAVIGNNGASFAPHVHIGAWKGDTPYQIRFDLRAMGALERAGR
jgi:hypothetical protein